MFKKILKFIWRLALTVSLFVFSGVFFPKLLVLLYASPRTFTVDNVPSERVAIVFGAGLLRDGSAGPVLRDRVETAVQLYQQGKVNKLLMSGDNRVVEHNEPEAMRQYALAFGIPDEAIVLDYAGLRTYDTCYRAQFHAAMMARYRSVLSPVALFPPATGWFRLALARLQPLPLSFSP